MVYKHIVEENGMIVDSGTKPPTAEEVLLASAEDYFERLAALSFAEMAGRQHGFFSSLAFGASGIAYAFWYAAHLWGPPPGDPELLEQAERWSRQAVARQRHRLAFRVPGSEMASRPPSHFLYGLAGVYFVRALVASSRGDRAARARALARFAGLARASRAGSPELYNGTAGCLAGTAILFSRIGSPGLRELGDELAADLLRRAASNQAGVAGWPELRGQGLSHGSAGPFLALLLWQSASGAPLPEWVPAALLRLLAGAVADPESFCPAEYHPLLCNGFTGLVYLAAQACRVLGDPAFLGLAREAAGRMLAGIRAEPDLCCGRAGVASACLALARVDPDGPWREHARHLTLSTLLAEPGDWFSAGLYSGEAAIPCLALLLASGVDAGPPALDLPSE
jgi:hypothetical protein